MEQKIVDGVIESVAEALALDTEDVTLDSTLLDELGAESIDLLDILFRIDQSLGIKIQSSELGDHVQGGIPDEEFGDEEANVLTPKGLEQLKKVMPQIEEKNLEDEITPENVMSFFTVQNLTELVSDRADQ